MSGKTTDWIITYTGKKFYPLEPDPRALDIADIAHALSNICRYTGHTLRFYSVAEHSVRLARFFKHENRETQRCALLHDASEAYLSDLPRPLKNRPEFLFYRDAEERLQNMICMAFGVPTKLPPMVAKADNDIVGDEARALLLPDAQPEWDLPIGISDIVTSPNDFGGHKEFGWKPYEAEERFMWVFDDLWGRR